MSQDLLKNGGVEADWSEQKSHRCLVFPKEGDAYEKDVGNIFTPPNWLTWFRHDPGTWDQPEVRDVWKESDPQRVHSGQKGILLFTFQRKHDAGFLQQVEIEPGTQLRLTAWAHAWSNHPLEGHEDCKDDPRCSCGVGRGGHFLLEEDVPPLNGDPWNDAIGNFAFMLGIDPTGGTSPYADTVIWGSLAYIYNDYHEVPAVEATAQAGTVTVFLRSKTLWAFKHNDAYWDDARLIAIGEGPLPKVSLSHQPASPKIGEEVTIDARSREALSDVHLSILQPSGVELAHDPVVVGRDDDWHTWTWISSPVEEEETHSIAFSAAGGIETTETFDVAAAPRRGLPREQYHRTYVLLPPGADEAWALAIVDSTWDKHRYTIGGSADDSGIGDLDARRVIAVNPSKWPSDLPAFLEEHYPGVEYIPVEADTPTELEQKLEHL